jgi:hypothetical protein
MSTFYFSLPLPELEAGPTVATPHGELQYLLDFSAKPAIAMTMQAA